MDMLRLVLLLLVLSRVKAGNDTNAGVTATATGEWEVSEAASNNTWFKLTTSDSGQYIYALTGFSSPMLMSNDFGQNWYPTGAEVLGYVDITTNSSGQMVYVLYNTFNDSIANLYISTDFGETFSPQMSLPSAGQYQSIACNNAGNVVYVVGFDLGIYVSLDGGETWENSDNPDVLDEAFFEIVTGDSGQNATAVSGYDGAVFTTNDYGASWLRQPSWGSNSNQFTGVQMSSDGRTIMVVDSLVRGGIYISNNYGFDAEQLNSAPNITVTTLAASGDMQFIMTMNYGNTESSYFSSDGGLTWNLTTYVTSDDDAVEQSFFTMASSNTGQLIVAGDYGGYIYLFQPACSVGYDHVGFDALLDPNGYNLCYFCNEGYYGEYATENADEIVCIPCDEGSYSSNSPVFGSDSCSDCPYLYSTIDDASHDKSSCHVFEIEVPTIFQWILYSAGFVWFVLMVYYATRPKRMGGGGKNAFTAVFMVLVFPFFDFCTDISYLVISPFYHVSIFAICVVCFMHPVVLFVVRLCKLQALPTSIRFIWWLGYDTSAGDKQAAVATTHNEIGNDDVCEMRDEKVEVMEKSSGDFIPYPTITYPRDISTVVTSRFSIVFAFETHDNLLAISFEILVWCVALTLQLFTIFFLPVFMLSWLVVGMMLQLTQTITLTFVWNVWFVVWTGTDDFSDIGPGGADTEDLNYGILSHFLLEAVPGLILQALNNTLMRSWTKDSVAIMSVVMSIIVCINVLYKYLYHSTIHADPVGVKNIPIDRSIRVKIMFLSVDWSVLDARLPHYAKQLKNVPASAWFWHDVKNENENGSPSCKNDNMAKLDLEENLLSDEQRNIFSDDTDVIDEQSRFRQQQTTVDPSTAAASSDISSVSSFGTGSNISGWTGNKYTIADKLLLMYSSSDQYCDPQSSGGTNSEEEREDANKETTPQVSETPLMRLLRSAEVPPDMRGDKSLEHMDAEIVIELFTENQSITAFIDEMSKFDIPRIVSSKIYMHLKSTVKSMKF